VLKLNLATYNLKKYFYFKNKLKYLPVIFVCFSLEEQELLLLEILRESRRLVGVRTELRWNGGFRRDERIGELAIKINIIFRKREYLIVVEISG